MRIRLYLGLLSLVIACAFSSPLAFGQARSFVQGFVFEETVIFAQPRLAEATGNFSCAGIRIANASGSVVERLSWGQDLESRAPVSVIESDVLATDLGLVPFRLPDRNGEGGHDTTCGIVRGDRVLVYGEDVFRNARVPEVRKKFWIVRVLKRDSQFGLPIFPQYKFSVDETALTSDAQEPTSEISWTKEQELREPFRLTEEEKVSWLNERANFCIATREVVPFFLNKITFYLLATPTEDCLNKVRERLEEFQRSTN